MSPTPECDVLARASLPIPSSDAFWAVNPSPPQLPCNCKRARAQVKKVRITPVWCG